jgi:hypothetical protein
MNAHSSARSVLPALLLESRFASEISAVGAAM